jgi:hypothetical protein
MMAITRNDRMAAGIDGTFVVFMIGMRVNSLWKVHKWWPVVMAMPRMLGELSQRPELGFLHAESWFGRTTIMVQYWRSIEQLLEYSRNKDAQHLPAWRAFNRAVGTNGSVGLWHETYIVNPGTYENIYVNMPPFGLGKAGSAYRATGERQFAAARMAISKRRS